MRNTTFYCVFTLVLISAVMVCYTTLCMLMNEPSLKLIFICQCFNFLSSFMMLGVGLGLPLVVIASVLSWGQIALLMSGNINPHLGREGFVNVLKILFSKI